MLLKPALKCLTMEGTLTNIHFPFFLIYTHYMHPLNTWIFINGYSFGIIVQCNVVYISKPHQQHLTKGHIRPKHRCCYTFT